MTKPAFLLGLRVFLCLEKKVCLGVDNITAYVVFFNHNLILTTKRKNQK